MHLRRRRSGGAKPVHGPRNAREMAFAVLSEYKQHGRFVSHLLEEFLARSPDFRSDERRLATELINGVVRRQATLDALLAPHVTRKRHHIEGGLWSLVQLGAYQLAFLDAVPAYAAVSETVALAKSVGRRGWDGFANGVLRSLQRSITDEYLDEPGPASLPIAGSRFRQCAQNVFPSPDLDPIGYVADAFSFPRWLIEHWQTRFDIGELCRMGFWFDKPAPLCLRVNLLRVDRNSLLSRLADAGIRAAAGELSESVRLEGTVRVEETPGFADGAFSVQDESAMQAVDLLAPRPGEMVLDLCAAPGSKTTHMAERMQNSGTIIATDVRPDRLMKIEQNGRRLGISIIEPSLLSSSGNDLPAGPFDAALVDVPCSNTGVLGKRPEARWRISLAEIEELSHKQESLLRLAISRLKPGGRVVYSTCSIEPEENENVVQCVIADSPNLRLIAERYHRPGLPGDGGYQALLENRSTP